MADDTPKKTQAVGGRKLKTFANAAIFTTAVFGGLVLLNVAANVRKSRPWDLTEDHMHSLSPAAAEIIRSLPEPLRLKAYISGDMPPEYDDFVRYLSILLDQYEDAGKVTREVEVIEDGKTVKKTRDVSLITWERIDPTKLPKSKAQMHEDWLKAQAKRLDKSVDDVRHMEELHDAKLGTDPNEGKEILTQADLRQDHKITPQRIMIPTGNGFKELWVYLALELDFRGQREVITFQGNRTEGLEYQFTSFLKRLAFGKKKIGISSGNGELGEQQTSGMRGAIGDTMDISDVPLSDPKAVATLDGLDALVVAGPRKPLNDAALHAIDGFVMKGKPVLFLVDGMTFAGSSPMDAQIGKDTAFLGQPNDSGLDKLLDAYGFKVNKDVVIDVKHNTIGFVVNGREAFRSDAFFPMSTNLDNGRGGVLSGMQSLVLPYPSSVENIDKKRSKTDSLVPLARTSGAAFSSNKEVLVLSPGMTLDPKDGKAGPFTLGYAAIGTFRSAFAPPPPTGNMSEPPAAGNESPPHTRIAVVGDSDALNDLYLMMAQQMPTQDLATGVATVHTLSEWLVDDTALSRVRNKGTARPLEQISEDKRTVIKFGNIFGPPFALIAFGLITWRLRTSKRRRTTL